MSLAGCFARVLLLPSIFFLMVVMLDLHLAIFLEICTAVAFLHSLLMSWITVSDKCADAIFGLWFCIAVCAAALSALYVQRLYFAST